MPGTTSGASPLQDGQTPSLLQPPLLVFFDLGGVVVDVDLERARCAWSDTLGTSHDDFDRVFFESGVKHRMDRGQLGRDAALREVAALCADPPGEDAITRCWTSSLSLRPQVRELIHEVAGRARCAVISNTDPLHAEYIESTMGIGPAIERWIYSYQAGSMKPDAGILRFALRLLAVRPGDALLIDDREDNLAAAQNLGMDGLRYDNFESVRRGLAARGLLETGWLPSGMR